MFVGLHDVGWLLADLTVDARVPPRAKLVAAAAAVALLRGVRASLASPVCTTEMAGACRDDRHGVHEPGSSSVSKGSRRKRATRPWQDRQAMRDLSGLAGLAAGDDSELDLDGYEVRRIDASRAEKDYMCPSCGNLVPRGEGHVVVWPEDDSDLRRHWHRHCWRLEVRRSGGMA